MLYAFLRPRFKSCYDKHSFPVYAFLAHVDPVPEGSGRAHKSIPTVEQMYGAVSPSPEPNKEEGYPLQRLVSQTDLYVCLKNATEPREGNTD